MENLYKIKEALMRKLDESDTAQSGELHGTELSALHEITDTIKNLDKICMLEEGGEGYSSANRGQHYVRGHYSRDGGMGRGMDPRGYSTRRDSRGRYSRDDGRSEMMEHLEAALDSATEQDREDIRRFMRKLEQA